VVLIVSVDESQQFLVGKNPESVASHDSTWNKRIAKHCHAKRFVVGDVTN
jgi:hypothetical protein